jgi:hypothetical protein
MRTVVLITAACVGLLAATTAKAEFPEFPIWSDWGPGFGTWHYDPGQPKHTMSTVAGWGDDLSEGQHRYWGGPYFVDRRGHHPPYESYRGCQTEAVTTADGAMRRVKRCH